MTLASIASRVLDSKNIIAAMLVAGGLIASLYGMSKVPAQAAAIQKAIEDHSRPRSIRPTRRTASSAC